MLHRILGHLLPRSVTGRLLLLIFATLSLTLVAEFGHYWTLFRLRTDEQFADNLDLARGVGAAFRGYLENVLDQEYALGLALQHVPLDGQANQLLAANLIQVPGIDNYHWLNAQGRVVASSDVDAVGQDVSAEPAFQTISGGKDWLISDLIRQPDDRAVFVIARSLRDGDGALVGVVWARVDPTLLGAAIKFRPVGNAALVITDGAGRGVYRFPEVAMRWEDRVWLDTEPIIGDALAGKESVGYATPPPVFGAGQRLVAVVPINDTRWVAGAGRLVSDVNAPMIAELRRELTEELVIIALATLLALLVSRTISVPARRLQRYALSLARGERPAPIRLDGPKEMAEVANAFNSMAEEVRRRVAALRDSEEDFRLLAENAQDLIYRFRLGPNPGFDYVSPSAQAITGFSPEEHYADPDLGLKIVHPSDRHLLESLFQGRGPFGEPIVLRWIRKDGAVIWTEQRNVPIYDSEGRLVAMQGIARDITKRKEAEEASASYLRLLQVLLDAIPIPVFHKDTNAVYRGCNTAFAEYLGLPRDRIVGKTVFDVSPKHLAEVYHQADLDLLKTGGVQTYDSSVLHADGTEHDVAFYKATYTNPDGSLGGLVGTIVDITERKRVERLREDYLHAISHDLRAPLTIIQGQAQLLKRELEREQAEETLRRSADAIVTSSRRMNSMIQDLVDAARIESGQLGINPRPLDLRAFVLDLKERMAAAGGERIRIEATAAVSMVMADPDRLERILANLLGNALKYSAPDTPVMVAITLQPTEVVVSVADRGRGIAPEELTHLFGRYYRTGAAQQAREGLGLGLYITRGLVTAHGGRIWVESELGIGSTFYFSLPLASLNDVK